MQTLRQIKGRIRSIANTRKITSAMQMVSAAKLSRSRAAFHSYRVYMDRLESLLKNFSAGMKAASHPFLDEREDKSSATLCVIASDSGLCGTYNNNILSTAKKFLDSNKDRKIDVIAVGHEVSKFMKKRNIRVTDEYPNLYGKYNPKACDELTRLFIDKFTSGGSAEIYISYTKFSSSLRHVPVVEKFLPIPKPEGGDGILYLVEPDRQTLLNDLISKYLIHKIRAVMLEAFTSEHSARMFAMKNATDNADDLINRLTLQRNKARQAAITQEITEIAMSAEALKG